ncbi:MAG: hypothetical protein V3T21_00230 [Candidatus Margulisiibacteriota bacterium]
MVEKTLQKIRAIEEKAEEIVKLAHESSVVNLKKNRERHTQELESLEKQSKKEEKDLLASSQEEAQKEVKVIGADSKKEIDELKKKSLPKTAQAKKEVLRCLS